MLDVHSCLVVSAWPVPMYLFWRDSSCCWVRSLSACMWSAGIRHEQDLSSYHSAELKLEGVSVDVQKYDPLNRESVEMVIRDSKAA